MATHLTPINNQQLETILTSLKDSESSAFFDTNRHDAQNTTSYLFTTPVAFLTLSIGDSVDIFFQQLERYLKKGFYLAGWCSYELGAFLERSLATIRTTNSEEILAEFGVFPAPLRFDHTTTGFNPVFFRDRQKRSREKETKQEGYTLQNLRTSEPREQYLNNIEKIKSYIAAGDTYQVNYTLKLLFDFCGDPTSLYTTLRQNQSVSYGAYLKFGEKIIQSFSPELFFRKEGPICTVRPMKGTSRRGFSLAEDQTRALQLAADPKNRSENVMIVDLLRNDLGRICRRGQVEVDRLFEVETYETLHQMTSTIHGHVREETSVADLFKALFPCGSVTGAPKIRTMEIIHELEALPRGVYTGAIGYITPKGDMTFNVPIRTVVLRGDKGEMGIGSGIVHDSEPEKEWQESLLKGRFLTTPQADFQLIETLLWLPNSGIFLLPEHLARLEQSAQYFNVPFRKDLLKKDLEKQADSWEKQEISAQRIRVLLFRDGRYTITPTPCATPRALTLPRAGLRTKAKALLSTKQSSSKSIFLYHKTTNRRLYREEFDRAVEAGYQEVFFTNERGELTEGAISNILIEKGGRFFTPPVPCGILAGTMRGHLLASFPGKVCEKVLYQKDLTEADRVYMINSVRGLVEVDVTTPQP